MIHILILESNTERGKKIASVLRECGYGTLPAADAGEALGLLDSNSVQLIVGNSACGTAELTEELREGGNAVPVIIITENEARTEKRRIFRSGADGYMTIPLDLEELQMRVKSLLWRCRIVDDASLRFGSCCLHAGTLIVETPREEIELRRMEFLLLEKLLSYPGRIFTRPQLLDELWGFESQSDPRTVDTHIRRLRQKLREVDEIRIQTVRGLGYRAAMPRRLRKAEKVREREEIE